MVCESNGSVIVCGPPAGVYKRRSLKSCPECGRESRAIERWDGAWYGVTDYCECGDRWQDGERTPRPFRRGWRKEAQAQFERMWEAAAPDDLYEAYTRADLQLAMANDDEEIRAAARRRIAAHEAILAAREDS